MKLSELLEETEDLEIDYYKEKRKLEGQIDKAKQIYYEAVDQATKNGTYIDKVAVDMFNILEGNVK